MGKILLFDISEVIVRGLVGIDEQEIKKSTGKLIKPKLKWFDSFGYEDYLLGRINKNVFLNGVIERGIMLKDIEKGEINADELDTAIKENLKISIPGMIELVNDIKNNLKKNGISSLGIYSDHGKDYADFVMKEHKLNKLFPKNKRLFSFDLGYLKHHPESFFRLPTKLNCKAGDIIYIDDKARNISKAKRFGINAIQFQDLDTLTKELETTFKIMRR